MKKIIVLAGLMLACVSVRAQIDRKVLREVKAFQAFSNVSDYSSITPVIIDGDQMQVRAKVQFFLAKHGVKTLSPSAATTRLATIRQAGNETQIDGSEVIYNGALALEINYKYNPLGVTNISVSVVDLSKGGEIVGGVNYRRLGLAKYPRTTEVVSEAMVLALLRSLK